MRSPIDLITTSLLRRSAASIPPTTKTAGDSDDETRRTAWLPGSEIFLMDDLASTKDSFLSFFKSSEGRVRSFCGLCGTNLGSLVSPMLESWPEMLDLMMGTIDRDDLDSKAMTPERILWCDCGVS